MCISLPELHMKWAFDRAPSFRASGAIFLPGDLYRGAWAGNACRSIIVKHPKGG
jgi:hypothetical protein